MKIKLFILLLIVSFVTIVMLSSCNNDYDPDPLNPDYTQEKGLFMDKRDGKIYKWVRIGDQIWMAENLAYTGSDIQHITDDEEWENNHANDGWCYYDNDETLGEKYGVLYQFEAAKIACPDGWHLPMDWIRLDDTAVKGGWRQLAYFIEATGDSGKVTKMLKSRKGWYKRGGGVDKYGFSALPGGYRSYDGSFYDMKKLGYWWGVQDSSFNSDYLYMMSYKTSTLYEDYFIYGYYGYCVRCVKDK